VQHQSNPSMRHPENNESTSVTPADLDLIRGARVTSDGTPYSVTYDIATVARHQRAASEYLMSTRNWRIT
jgi:hypothetical protein